MTEANVQTPQLEPGSFRDRNGRVFYFQGQVYRYLSEAALQNWKKLSQTQFFPQAVQQGRVVKTEQVQDAALQSSEWVAILRHQKIPVISYPYEWCFGMLQDAALLQLQLLDQALDEGMILKDSSAYNVQWVGVKPVFIDIPSFEVLQPGDIWVGYHQFCQLFLFPLMLQAYKDVSFQPWLRGALDGISATAFSQLFSWGDYLKPGVFKHVMLQSKLQAQYANSTQDIRGSLSQAGFGPALIKTNVANLLKLVSQLKWQPARSEWSDYADNNRYSELEHQQKITFIREVSERKRWPLVWDLGCNMGTFSRLVAEQADVVLALDADHLVIERLYQSLKHEASSNILPMVMNLADPSPSFGWQGLERKTLPERGKPDLILCLALIHHLVISANIPVQEYLSWLRGQNAAVVLEFVTKEDPQVKTLLRNRVEQYHDYELTCFESVLESLFKIEKRLVLANQTRILYFATPK